MTCLIINIAIAKVGLGLLLAGEPAPPPTPPPPQAALRGPSRPADPHATWRRAWSEELAGIPSVAEVQRAAARRLAVDPSLARRWRKRARAAAALPVLRGEYDLRTDQGWQLDQEAGNADELSQDLGAGHSVSVRATWELDRLIFDDNELRAARAAIDVERERERLLVLVTQLYFERLQLLLEDRLAGPPATASEQSAVESLQRRVRVAEIEAVLYAMTGLEFPRQRSTGRTSRPGDDQSSSSPRATPRAREFGPKPNAP